MKNKSLPPGYDQRELQRSIELLCNSDKAQLESWLDLVTNLRVKFFPGAESQGRLSEAKRLCHCYDQLNYDYGLVAVDPNKSSHPVV